MTLPSSTSAFAVAPDEKAHGFRLGSNRVSQRFGPLALQTCSLSGRNQVTVPPYAIEDPCATPAFPLNPPKPAPEEGFALIALVVAIFVILLFLSIAAPKVARDLRRERELEAIQRGNQYVRAIQLYYKKFGRYPGSIEQLEKTNNIRFLRQQYIDPMTGKPDWRIILVGQNKTTVKGLFGQPLAGIPTTGIGGTSTPGTAIGGSSSSFGASNTTGTTGSATATTGGSTSTFGQTGSATGSTGSSFGSTIGSTGGSTGIGSQSATDFKGAAGPFMGVGHNFSGDSIITLNEQTDYGTWEFIYDPRIEQLKAKSNLFGGGAATSATSPALGSSFGNGTSAGTSPTSPTTTSPTTTSPTTTPQTQP